MHSLKRDSSDFDPSSLKDKIENLYRQKQVKQADLDHIKRVGRALIDDPNTGDVNRLKETLADTQGKWHDLTELLVQMISFAVSSEGIRLVGIFWVDLVRSPKYLVKSSKEQGLGLIFRHESFWQTKAWVLRFV